MAARLGSLTAAAGMLVFFARAVAIAASPTPYLEDATIVGASGTLSVDRVPVQTATGSIVYRDILMVFGADSTGELSLLQGYPKFRRTPRIDGSGFVAGAYAGPPTLANGQYLITVTGPGVGVSGSTQWLLSTAQGADQCTYPASAFWFTGPIADNPIASRLQAAGITSTEFSYGLAGGPCCDGLSGGGCLYFYNGALLGMTQVGNVLRIVSFSDTGNDHNSPTGQIVYTLSP